jgi:hypothetical protein
MRQRLEPSLYNHYKAFLDSVNAKASPAYSIYNNNIYANLVSVLANIFPLSVDLLGWQCFNAHANLYVKDNIPPQADLTFYGKGFIDFLALKHGNTLAYLADVMLLEWQYNASYYSANVTAIYLARCLPTSWSSLHLCPHVRLIRSPYPIFSIWQEAQNGWQRDVDMGQLGGQNIIISRDENYQPYLLKVTNTTFNLVNQMGNGDLAQIMADNITKPFFQFVISNGLLYCVSD